METTISLAKEHGLAALILLAKLYVAVNAYNLCGQKAEGRRSIPAEMAAGYQAPELGVLQGATHAVLERSCNSPATGERRKKTPGRSRGFWLRAAKPPG